MLKLRVLSFKAFLYIQLRAFCPIGVGWYLSVSASRAEAAWGQRRPTGSLHCNPGSPHCRRTPPCCPRSSHSRQDHWPTHRLAPGGWHPVGGTLPTHKVPAFQDKNWNNFHDISFFSKLYFFCICLENYNFCLFILIQKKKKYYGNTLQRGELVSVNFCRIQR